MLDSQQIIAHRLLGYIIGTTWNREDYKHTLSSTCPPRPQLQGRCFGAQCLRRQVCQLTYLNFLKDAAGFAVPVRFCYCIKTLLGQCIANPRLICRGIDVVRNKIKMFAQKKVTLPPGRHKIVILDEADRSIPPSPKL